MITEEPACCHQCRSGLPQNLAILLTSFLVFFKKSEAFPCTKPDQILWKKNNSSRYRCLGCPECPQGYHPSIPCGTTADYGTPLHCVPCPVGTFSDTYDGAPCHLCTKCNERQIIQKNCTAQSNSKCSACKRGYYEDTITGDCHPCSPCCRDKKNVRIDDCQSQGMPSDMICQYHGVPCQQIQKSSIGPSLPSVISKTTPRPVTKQSKLTTHPISFKTYPEELKTSQTPTKFQDLNSKQVPFDGKSNAFLIVAIILLAVLIACILLAVLLYFVFVKHRRDPKHGKRNDDKSTSMELLPTDTSEASRVTVPTSGLALLIDLQQYQSNCFDRLCTKLEERRRGRYEFERMGALYDLDKDRVASLRNTFNGDGQSPAKYFIDLLTSVKPRLTICDFCEKLDKIERPDISDLLKPFLFSKVGKCENGRHCD